MAGNASTEQLEKSIAAGAVGFGVLAGLAPRVFTALYGLGPDPRTKALARTWGTRTAALGAVWFVAGNTEARRRLTTVAVAMNAVDAVLGATATDLPVRTRVLGAASSGAFAAASAYVLAQG